MIQPDGISAPMLLGAGAIADDLDFKPRPHRGNKRRVLPPATATRRRPQIRLAHQRRSSTMPKFRLAMAVADASAQEQTA